MQISSAAKLWLGIIVLLMGNYIGDIYAANVAHGITSTSSEIIEFIINAMLIIPGVSLIFNAYNSKKP